MKYQAEIEEQKFDIQLVDEENLSVDGEAISFSIKRGSKPEHFSLILNGRSFQVWIENGEMRQGEGSSMLRVHLSGFDYEVKVDDERSMRIREFAGADTGSKDIGQIRAPMPGLVVKLLVETGQEVKKGEGLLIVEAMKMENEIKSPVNGAVTEIRVAEKQTVEKGEILIVVG